MGIEQLQMLVVEETSQKLLGLYRYERGRVAMGSMSEATYRNNARLLLEGDDCFQVEQLYSGGGGELLLQFLPEKEADEKEGEEEDVEEEEDEVEECSAVSKAEWSAYMDSYVQVASSGASSSRLKATTSPPATTSRAAGRRQKLSPAVCPSRGQSAHPRLQRLCRRPTHAPLMSLRGATSTRRMPTTTRRWRVS